MLLVICSVLLVTSFMVCLFVVGMRLSGRGVTGYGKIPWFILTSYSGRPFLQCQPHLTPGGSGVLADLARIDEEFRKAWLPYFCRSGQRDTSLEFNLEVEGWLPLLPEFELPRLTGRMLAEVVLRKGATAISLDGWVGGN